VRSASTCARPLNRIRERGRDAATHAVDLRASSRRRRVSGVGDRRRGVDRYEQALARLKDEEREAIIARGRDGLHILELAEPWGNDAGRRAKAAHRALVRLAER
jgi:DNA-directed RNA polymerase specialized sigma24 family protein